MDHGRVQTKQRKETQQAEYSHIDIERYEQNFPRYYKTN